MKCKRCDWVNDTDASYCNVCGTVLQRSRCGCGQENRPGSRFCKSCGRHLHAEQSAGDRPPSAGSMIPGTALQTHLTRTGDLLGGERRHVTVLFTDLCGYTALSERLDPEEVKEIIALVFNAVAEIVNRYEGFIEKFIGDAIMAVFGALRAHEDDPIRAVRAAREIHQWVAQRSAREQERIGTPLAMHTGINTGLVILGHLNADHGTHGISGDTVNLAARMSELGREGDILVGQDTFLQCQGWFRFETLAPVQVKGKVEPLPIYRVLSSREQPRKVHRIFGRRGAMIGRQAEMDLLTETIARVGDGQGAVVCISGAAGTGKSRLLEEFRQSLGQTPVGWHEGHAYPYASNIPYAPVIDMLNLACHIQEGDSPGVVRKKIEYNLAGLLDSRKEQLPYIGNLLGLHYPQLVGISPEYWRSCLKKAIEALLRGISRLGPVVICIEDLHWADPSSVELLRAMAGKEDLPLMLICTFRKTFSLYGEKSPDSKPRHLIEIKINDLSPEQTQQMVQSMLGIPAIPQHLIHFVREKIEGNPFYLEEMINALIERQTLRKRDSNWVIQGPVDTSDISSTIHGVVAGRLAHLQSEAKHVLQEASVIGRVFDFAILQQISSAGDRLEASLETLQQLDMIRKKDDSVEVKYFFKHAVVQEVVYNSVLLKDRRSIHERIAVAMEHHYRSRLNGFFETLAFHYSVGRSVYKAVDYLMKSGQKSKQRYALEEAHQYYQRAYEQLHDHPERSPQRAVLLVNVLIEWFFVFNVRGIFNEMIELLKRHEDEAMTLKNPFLQGMYCCCMGWALQRRESLEESHDYLMRALQTGERADNREVQAYACGCLVWTCTDMGRLAQAIGFGRRAEALLAYLETDQELIRIILTGMGIAHWFCGDGLQCQSTGEMLLAHGEQGADIRSTSDGYLVCAMGRFAAGDYDQSIEYCNMAIAASAEMVHALNAKFLLAYTHL
ncbi:MAG: adenylate/guanylate cyclase domain-containing protein, partial [Desulfobacterales bacterium]